MKGRITSINHVKGFGFLRGDDGLSRFFHARSVLPVADFDLLKETQIVEFEPYALSNPNADLNNGLRARSVRRVA